MTENDIATVRTFVAQIDATRGVLQECVTALLAAAEPIFPLVATLATDSPLCEELQELLAAIEDLDGAACMLEMQEILEVLTRAMADEKPQP